ncbi:hypothetical protein RB195_009733 [Necator americanus]|uniref:Uncharacterized protein n=1 Tax=Necator americanus TaxID=51031 RepID=A0ABR1CUP3_NECAM
MNGTTTTTPNNSSPLWEIAGGEKGWMRSANRNLKLWRKVKGDQHKLLQLFRFYIEEAVLLPAGNEMDANYPSLSTSQN